MTYTPNQIAREITANQDAFERGPKVLAHHLEAETDKAMGFPSRDEGNDDLVWIPKSVADTREMIDEAVDLCVEPWFSREHPDALDRILTRNEHIGGDLE